MCAGAATTTIYPTTEARDACYILTDSGSKVLIGKIESLANIINRGLIPSQIAAGVHPNGIDHQSEESR